MKMFYVFFLAFHMVIVAGVANGDECYWDESVDGDLSNFINNPSDMWCFGQPFPIVQQVVNSSVGGPEDPTNGDGYDIFTFATNLDDAELGFFRFDSYAGSGTSNLDIYFNGNLVVSTTVSAADIGRNFADDFYSNTQGYYVVSISDFDAVDQQYSLTWAIVPEPSSAGLSILFLFGLVFSSRTRDRTSNAVRGQSN